MTEARRGYELMQFAFEAFVLKMALDLFGEDFVYFRVKTVEYIFYRLTAINSQYQGVGFCFGRLAVL